MNFDEELTGIDPELEEIDPAIVRQFDQSAFTGFSFVNVEMFHQVSGRDVDTADTAESKSLAEVRACEDK